MSLRYCQILYPGFLSLSAPRTEVTAALVPLTEVSWPA